ncbi:MAG: sigma-70 family RNA polymerase sigma factor [Planctomycetes bacterium]|nr:sigma-70 family RNA polymerase sigma factor [Planctomycetota bacterium]
MTTATKALTSARQAAEAQAQARQAGEAHEAQDARLWVAVAARRDRQAFEELYARHKDRTYALLVSILQNPADAQDALQNTFVRIWRSAHTVRDRERFAPWILQVAAREGLRLHVARRCRKNSGRSLDDCAAEPAARRTDPAIAALRDQVAELEPSQRRLVALYFGGNLSQEEIARALNCSQRSVSSRINEALERLREGMRRAGFAAVVPLLDSGALCQALTSGLEAPAFAQSGLATALKGASASAGKQSFPALWACASTVLLAAACMGWALYPAALDDAAPAANSAKPADSAAPLTLPAPESRAALKRFWPFEQPAPAGDFQVITGSWKHVPGTPGGARGCMQTDADRPAMIRIATPPLRYPVKIEAMLELVEATQLDRWVFTVGFPDKDLVEAGLFHNAGGVKLHLGNLVSFKATIYVSDEFQVTHTAGVQTNITYARARPGAPLNVIAFGRYSIRDLSLKQIAPSEFPDTAAFRTAVREILRAGKPGVYEMPSLPTRRPPQPVSFEYKIFEEPARPPGKGESS